MSLSTHVLDVTRGRPAAGVAVELRRGDETIVSALTDADGRARLADALAAVGAHVVGISSRSRFWPADRPG